MKNKVKYGLGWIETSTKPVEGDVKATEPVVNVYAIDTQILVFENRTKAQGALDFLKERYRDRLDQKIEVIELSLFTE